MGRHTAKSTTELPRSDRAPGVARAFLADYLSAAHATGIVDEAALLTTEAVTNAIRYAGPPVELSVECGGDCIEIRVHDTSPTPPRHVVASPLDTGGRGVDLIDTVAEQWGVLQYTGDGKDVWFRLVV